MGKRILRGITWDHIRGFGPLHASTEPYRIETGITVQWSKRSLKDFGDASLENLAKEYDLIVMDHPHVGVASSLRCVLPLDEFLSKETLDQAREFSAGPSFKSYQYHNHLWALPIDAACQVSCRRDDLLDSDFLPRHWSDVFDLADQLRRKNRFIGMALCATDCNCCFLTLCAQFGDPIQEERFTSEETGLRALALLKKLYDVSHPESGTWNPVRLYDHMASHDDVAYSPLAFGYTNYSRQGYHRNILRYGLIPERNNALLGGAGIAVSVYSKTIKEASTYAAWLCSEEYQCRQYVIAGGQPAHIKAWTNSLANEIAGNFFSDTMSTLERAYVRPRNRKWPDFQERLGEIIHAGLTNRHHTEDIWNQIVKTYDDFFWIA